VNKIILAVMLLSAAPTTLWGAEVRFGDHTTVQFATLDEGRRILGSSDDFVRSMSPFDLAARLKTPKSVSEQEFLAFAARSVLAWEEGEKRIVESAIQRLQPRLATLALPLPEKVYLIKTTGQEEGGAPYTRANAVVLPRAAIATSETGLARLIGHELFHVLSRANPELRDRLYEAIGFVKCGELEFPAALKSRKITNPDAPHNDHCIRLQADGKPVWAIPILYSRSEKYDPARGGEFFAYLQFQFLVVERRDVSLGVEPVLDGREPRLLDLQDADGFFEQVGRNTGYLIHPEEILADNFALLVMPGKTVRSPKILSAIENVLKEGRAGR